MGCTESRLEGDIASQHDKHAPADAKRGLGITAAEEKQLRQMLMDAGQAHLFEGWPAEGASKARKTAFFQQVRCIGDLPLLKCVIV